MIAYTLTGGTKAVNATQKLQMGVIFIGLLVAFFTALGSISETMTFADAIQFARTSDKMNILDFSFDLENRYTFWSGIIGGTFLALSYFGTDQSQVQRYLSSQSTIESQKGLIMNGLLKVPLQFFILFIGVLVFVVLQSNNSPIFYNNTVVKAAHLTDYSEALSELELEYVLTYEQALSDEVSKVRSGIRDQYVATLTSALPDAETNDKDYVFLYFILNYLPRGLIGLLLAMIFCAAMSSTASELNALASTTTVDLYMPNVPTQEEDKLVNTSKAFTLLWGCVAILFACFGTLFENLIQFVNIIGSIFYGTILGVFLVAFFIKHIRGNAIFIAALISETLIIIIWWLDIVPFLWLNLIGCVITILLALLIQSTTSKR